MSTNNKIIEYVSSIQTPLEPYFFSDREKSKLAEQKAKFAATEKYLFAAMDKPELAEAFEKDLVLGKIHSASEAFNVKMTLRALEGDGNRIDIQKSLISPEGQFVILSLNAAKKMEIIADGYVSDPSSLEYLTKALQAEGLSIDLVKQAFNKYGAIIYQRGIYDALKLYLPDVLVASVTEKAVGTEPNAPTVPHGASLNALRQKLVTPPAAPMPPAAPVKPAASSGPAMTPNEIKREVNTKELTSSKPVPQPPPPAPKPAVPVPAPTSSTEQPKWVSAQPIKPKSAPLKLNNMPKMGLPSLNEVKVIDDLKLIEAAHLRQSKLEDQIRLIRMKIASLAEANKLLPVQVESVFEQSPLFRLYLQMGNALMAATTPDMKPDYNQLAADLDSKGQEVLSFSEFQAVADMRKDLAKG